MDADHVKTSVDIMQLISCDTSLKKVSSSGGDEYAGACPFCGGKDRFRVQPNRPDGGKWYCRGCGEGKWHDAIDYVSKRDNLDFQSALSTLAGDIPIQQKREKPNQIEREEPTIDREKWTDTARRFVNMCAEKLWDPSSSKALEYLHSRGLLDDTLITWQIGYHPDEANGNPLTWGMSEDDSIYLHKGIVIPCFSETTLEYVKIRKSSGRNAIVTLKGVIHSYSVPPHIVLFRSHTYSKVSWMYYWHGRQNSSWVMAAYRLDNLYVRNMRRISSGWMI